MKNHFKISFKKDQKDSIIMVVFTKFIIININQAPLLLDINYFEGYKQFHINYNYLKPFDSYYPFLTANRLFAINLYLATFET